MFAGSRRLWIDITVVTYHQCWSRESRVETFFSETDIAKTQVWRHETSQDIYFYVEKRQDWDNVKMFETEALPWHMGVSLYSADVKFWHRLRQRLHLTTPVTSGSRCRAAADRIRQRAEETLPFAEWLIPDGGIMRKFLILCPLIFIALPIKMKCYLYMS